VTTTVFGEKLGAAWASHSSKSDSRVPFFEEVRDASRASSVESAARALAASRLPPLYVRST